MMPTWSRESCIECVACVGSCPEGALRYTTNRRIIVDQASCISCGRCVMLCPAGALAMVEVDGDG